MRETSRKPCDASGQAKPEPESDCESGKDTAATSTLSSDPEGSQDSLPTDVNELRIQTRNLLTAAAVQGKLVAALSALPPRQAQGEQIALKEMLATAVLDGRPSEARDRLEETRKMARDALLSAVADARLTPLLSVEPAQPPIDEMRTALKGLFTGAVRHGHLVPTLRQVSLHSMRRTAREALVAAAASGRLDSHLKAMQRQRRLEAARLTAKEALMDAAADGRLYHHLAAVQRQKEQDALPRDASAEAGNDAAATGDFPPILFKKDALPRDASAEAGNDTAATGDIPPILFKKEMTSKKSEAVVEACTEATVVWSSTTCLGESTDKSEALEEKLRVEARDVLALAISNGSLEAVLQEVQQEKKERRAQQEAREKLRLRVQALFSRSVLDGRLAAVMEEVKQHSSKEEEMDALRAQVREVMIKASDEGQLQAELARIKKQDSVQDIVKQAGQSLISAALSGRLRQAVQAVKKPAKEEEALKQPGEAEQQEVAKLLSSAAWDGRLGAALSEVKAERQQPRLQNFEHLRAQASEALARAAASGKLSSSLSKAQAQHREKEEEQEETKQLLAQARKTLKSAAADGRLLAVFTQLQQQKAQNTLETSRTTARKILCEAAADGRLEKVLSKCPQRARAPQEDTEAVENLRRYAKNTLVQSSLRGELTTVIQRVTSDTASEAIRLKARDALLKALTPGHPGQAEAHEGLRLFAKDVLLQAAQDGRLSKAIDEVQASKAILQAEPPLQSAAPSEDERALKEHARLAFTAAAADGRLAEVCKGLREGRLSPASSSPEKPAAAQAKQALKAGLRRSVRETLASSAVDGRLLSALTGQSPKEEASAPPTPLSVHFAASEPGPAQAPSPLLAERVPTPTPQPGSGREKRQAVAKLPLHQISSSRQKRRIYMDRAQASPSRRFRQDARTPAVDLALDDDEAATREGREGRLSQGSEALTAVFRSIGDKDNSAQPLRPMSPMGSPSAAPTPPPTSRSSHRSARHRTHLALSSAMAQDLGLGGSLTPKGAQQAVKPVPRSLNRAALTASAAALDLGEGLGGERWGGSSRCGTPACRASRSLGALPGFSATPFAYSGKTANTVLPPLRGQRQAGAAVQWSRQMSRGSQRWADTQVVF